MPKCASTSFVDLLNRLSSPSSFCFEFNPSGAYNWGDKEKASVANQITSKLLQKKKKKLVYARHFYYLDFSDFGLANFTYVTIIRDPIERVISSYLYYHFSSKKHIRKILDPKHRNETLLTCLRHQHEGCTHNLLTKYFCGHAKWCNTGNQQALQTAKENLRTGFAVVGIMEEMELSMRLVRHLLPQFFCPNTARRISLPRALNRNENMVSPSVEERQAVKEANLADVELYSYAQKLLHDQAELCKQE